jgi:general secretion pathway protein A
MEVYEYFGYNEDPFKVTPDQRFLYMSEQVKEAIGKCEYMASKRVGPIYMYGPMGMGKTTILRRLNELLGDDDRYNVLTMVAPNVKQQNSVLRFIMDEWKVKTERSYMQSLKNFQDFLIEQNTNGKVPVLLVDEAQNFSKGVLDLIHYLLNFETADFKLLQIILIGQEELGVKILKYKQLASRMFPISMRPMALNEMREMVQFRLLVAGAKEPIFEEDECYKILHEYTQGLPRDAIRVCSQILVKLLTLEQKHASPEIVRQIAEENNLRPPEKPKIKLKAKEDVNV